MHACDLLDHCCRRYGTHRHLGFAYRFSVGNKAQQRVAGEYIGIVLSSSLLTASKFMVQGLFKALGFHRHLGKMLGILWG